MDIQREPVVRRGGVRYNIPEKYLEEELVFSSLPPSPLTSESTTVVGSNSARLYRDTADKRVWYSGRTWPACIIPRKTI